MKLPAPRAQLGGCIWLPRILAKARMLQRGELPAEYEARFCHPTGVDGQFISYFGLNREELLAVAGMSDQAVVEWFVAREAAAHKRIEEWNDIAINLGRPGYPMAERFPIAKATAYSHIDSREMTTVFEVLEADEREV